MKLSDKRCGNCEEYYGQTLDKCPFCGSPEVSGCRFDFGRHGDGNINHPKHYNSGNIECIDALKESLGPEGFKSYIKGNVLKYLWREQFKNGDEDLKKAKWYLDYYIKEVLDNGK